MSALKCELCGKLGYYPTFIISKGIGVHVACMADAWHKSRQDVRRLREACEAALLLADAGGSLPDNGEYHGGAIADQIRCALEDTAPAHTGKHAQR